jgi:hypothetical protein
VYAWICRFVRCAGDSVINPYRHPSERWKCSLTAEWLVIHFDLALAIFPDKQYKQDQDGAQRSLG